MPPIVIPCRQQIIRQNFMINTITQNNMFAKTPLNLINRHRSHHHILRTTWNTKQRKFTFRKQTAQSTGGTLKCHPIRLSGNFWLVSFKISYLCLPLFYETRTTPSCHPSGCAYRQL